MSLACERDGVIETDKKTGEPIINKKGVLLQRRDNCNTIRMIYAKIAMMIFNKNTKNEILLEVIESLNKICSYFYSSKDFVITKSVGDIGNLKPYKDVNDKGKQCLKVGDYTVRPLAEDEKKRQKQFKDKNCSTEEEYYLRCLPAQAQLAERMRRRGQLVAAGSRVEYVITTTGGHTAKQYMKIESADYYNNHSNSLSIDFMYYVKQLGNPLDQVLDILFEGKEADEDGNKYEYKYIKNFVLDQYKYRLKVRGKMLDEIKSLFKPELKFSS